MEFMTSNGFSNIYAKGHKDCGWFEIQPDKIWHLTNGATICYLRNYYRNKFRMFWHKFLNVILS